MRITLNSDRCEGYGICADTAPDLMHLDDEGELVLDTTDVAAGSLPKAESAVRACPVAALRLADEEV